MATLNELLREFTRRGWHAEFLPGECRSTMRVVITAKMATGQRYAYQLVIDDLDITHFNGDYLVSELTHMGERMERKLAELSPAQ